MSSDDDLTGDQFLCLYFPERETNTSPRSEIRIFNFTIKIIDDYPNLREVLSPLTIPKHSIYTFSEGEASTEEDSVSDLTNVYCIFGDNIIQKSIPRDTARIVFEKYLSEITTTIPFSGNMEINLFSNTINGLNPRLFLEAIRIKFFEED